MTAIDYAITNTWAAINTDTCSIVQHKSGYSKMFPNQKKESTKGQFNEIKLRISHQNPR